MAARCQPVAMAHTITVSHVAGERFTVDIRGHRLAVDQRNAVPGLESRRKPNVSASSGYSHRPTDAW